MDVLIPLIHCLSRDNYKDVMIEDLARNSNFDVAMSIAVNDINTILLVNGTNCAAISLPIPIDNSLYVNSEPNLEQQEGQLNNEQRELVLLAVHGDDPMLPK